MTIIIIAVAIATTEAGIAVERMRIRVLFDFPEDDGEGLHEGDLSAIKKL